MPDFVKRQLYFVPHSVIDRQLSTGFPVILPENRYEVASLVLGDIADLPLNASKIAQQEIREIVSCERAVECVRAGGVAGEEEVHAFTSELAAELPRVRAAGPAHGFRIVPVVMESREAAVPARRIVACDREVERFWMLVCAAERLCFVKTGLLAKTSFEPSSSRMAVLERRRTFP